MIDIIFGILDVVVILYTIIRIIKGVATLSDYGYLFFAALSGIAIYLKWKDDQKYR